ncbi:MAG: MetQ/NlpA family ABC transporter substrate-binding protein [Coriobacteriia bacterium]|nr:MetQ/NlpA family ABC transporter substrate-binding protein [Coriobacteriia bacterium]
MSIKNFIKPAAGILASGALALSLVACGGSSASSSSASSDTSAASDNVITVGASPSPHAEILNAVADELKAEGYELKVVEYNDYIQPNVALADGDLDANYFQHAPYLENYNEENGTDLVSAYAIHFEPMGIYAGKSSDIKNVPDGAKIAVPSDATNEARALLLLQDQGVITLKDGAGLEATANDIESNPHNIELVEVEAAAVARSLEDVDFAIINGNYALSAGLDTSATLASEAADSEAAQTYANIIAVRKGDEDNEKTRALIKALTSQTAEDFIESEYKGSVIPVF